MLLWVTIGVVFASELTNIQSTSTSYQNPDQDAVSYQTSIVAAISVPYPDSLDKIADC